VDVDFHFATDASELNGEIRVFDVAEIERYLHFGAVIPVSRGFCEDSMIF
jgi:hypothetical protein